MAAKETFTTCQDVCDTLTATACTVTTTHVVTAGSVIDCSPERTVTISGGSAQLEVKDGTFRLSSKRLFLTNGGKIVASCPQGFTPVGFTLQTAEYVTLVSASQAKLAANCTSQGGRIAIQAGTNITIDALGIDVDGGSTDAPGGAVLLEAGGTIMVAAAIHADAKAQGAGAGGTIRLRGATVTVEAELRAKGYGTSGVEMPGGDISLEATGDIVISNGSGVNVGSAHGSGGDITIDAGGLADIRKPLRAWGTGSSVGEGGTVTVAGDGVRVNGDIVVTGGRQGGGIEVVGEAGGVSVGTTASATLDASGGGNESGGTIEIGASGDVTLGGSAVVLANGGTGGAGGAIEVTGDDVLTNSGAVLRANGAAPNRGGQVEVTARGGMTLAGTYEANNQGSKTFLYTSGTPSIASGITDYELVQMADL